MIAQLLIRGGCSACAEARPVKGWLRQMGIAVTELDVGTPEGLAEAAWLDAADLEALPVLLLHDDAQGELRRWVGALPSPAQLRRFLLEVSCGA